MSDRGASGLFARLEPRHVVLVGVVAALVAFLPSVADGFVFDDQSLIVRNPFAHDLAYAGRCFVTDLWDTPDRAVAESSTRFYRPAVCLSYILNFELGGASPWSFHLVNVGLHAIACALAARLAWRWTGSLLGALLATLVFAVHPTHTENVVWVSGRTDVLMAAFLLGAHELAVSAARRKDALRWVASGASFVAALLSKEVAICWPVLLGVEALLARDAPDSVEKPDGTRRGEASSGAAPTRAALALTRATVASLLVVVAYVVIRGATLPLRPPEIESMTLPLGLHAGYVALSLGYYTERVFFPWPQTFHFRPLSIVGGEPALFMPSVGLGVVVAALWLAWLVRAWRRERTLAAMLGVAALLVLPISNVSYTGFPGTTADRFLYLPLFFVAVAAARHAGTALDRWAARPLSPLVTSAATLVACAICWVRSLDYVSNDAIWRHELEVNPDNPQALAGLSQLRASEGDLDEATALLRRALSPAALRYKLLANPSRYYLGLLEMQGPRLADGNVAALESLLGELGSLVGVLPPKERRAPPQRAGDLVLAPPLWDEHFSIHLANATEHLSAAAALVASRLGLDHGQGDLLHPLLARVGDGLSLDAPAHYNLALALGRGADYPGARRELARAASMDGSNTVRTVCDALATTLAQVERLRTTASGLGEPAASVDRAAAYLDLGAYLRAARTLRAEFAVHPDDPTISGPYIDALVSARLDADADAAAAKMPDSAAGRARVETARLGLSRRTANALPPPAGAPW
jgi:tetratricopeptide (TPR) repeat protein